MKFSEDAGSGALCSASSAGESLAAGPAAEDDSLRGQEAAPVWFSSHGCTLLTQPFAVSPRVLNSAPLHINFSFIPEFISAFIFGPVYSW